MQTFVHFILLILVSSKTQLFPFHRVIKTSYRVCMAEEIIYNIFDFIL